MLARQHLGGRHEEGLPARIGRSGQREGGHDGLAGADVAQDQVVRRMGRGHLAQHVVARGCLLVGERERQRRGERTHPGAVRHVLNRLAPGGARRGLPHEEQLQHEQLLVGQAAARLGGLAHGLGKMDARKRRLTAHEPVLRTQGKRQRVVCATRLGKRVAHQAPHPCRGHLFRGGMHGDDHAGRPADALPHHLDERVGHALEPIVELQLARHGYAHARLEGVHEPRLAERRHHQHARLVHQADLDESELGPRALELDVVDGAFDGALLADAGRRHRLLGGKVDVAARVVRDQVAHRMDAQGRERAGARRAHQAHARDRLVQGQRRRHAVKSICAAGLGHCLLTGRSQGQRGAWR